MCRWFACHVHSMLKTHVYDPDFISDVVRERFFEAQWHSPSGYIMKTKIKNKSAKGLRRHRAVLHVHEKRLHRSNGKLALADRRLKQEIVKRKVVEETLRKKLEQAHIMREQMRNLSHQLLSAQEDERKKISRELHDQIAQTLTGINVYLETLQKEATTNTKGLKKKIFRTQRLVERSVDIVHRFACELRPTVLDDLGLIPALRSHMTEFSKRTGIHVRFTGFAGIEQLSIAKRTVLFRVAQTALANVAQHAQASKVSLSLQKLQSIVCMEIRDDGKAFQVERVLFAKKRNQLGLLGMRERVEMIGGGFHVESAPGKGTTIRVEIPLGKRARV